MNTKNNLEILRNEMRRMHVDAVIIPGTDPHQSEYLSDYWKFRDWLCGFTGSNGTAVVTLDAAALWTDSRYFLQAERQLAGSGIVLMRENGDEPDATIEEWLVQKLGDESVVAIDGRLFSVLQANQYERFCGENGFMLVTEFVPADKIWTDRPARLQKPAYVYDEELAGETVQSKMERLVASLELNGADAILISALDEIAWLFNLRGSDVLFTPVVMAHAYVSARERLLFIDPAKVTDEVRAHLKKYDVMMRDYDDVTRFLERRSEHVLVLIDPNKVSDTLCNALPCQKIYLPSPVAAMKAIKNEAQIAGTRRAMERDGAALVRLFMWIEQNAASGAVTELAVWTRGKEERAKGENYRGDSFAMIAGYKEHGAIVHYQADDESDATLRAEGLLLIDSGAQYLDGTTDITRTITLGNPAPEEKHDFTLVLKGHLALQRAQFPVGTTGHQLDALARMPLWQEGMTFWHGTGHGVGHFLSCHEGPQSVRSDRTSPALECGMIVSDEPGLYKAGRYGIRTENLLLVVEGAQNEEFGRFLRFEPLTLMPYDLRLIESQMLTPEEVRQINDYHRMVRERLTPYLNADEARWLQENTKEI